MASFNLIALDVDFNIAALIRCTNIQWSRKYHEPGIFSVQIPLEQYDPSFKYIYTKDRPEVGKITQINYVNSNNYRYIQLSGRFLEQELNRMVAYSKGTGNIVNGPDWVEKVGYAESVAYDFFNGFSSISIDDGSGVSTYTLGIASGTSKGRGRRVHHVRENSYLGNKIYDILKSSGMSYRVAYDFENNQKAFEVWSGKDRSEDQSENNPIVFSTRYGNIKNPNILIDESTYKSGTIVVNESNLGNEISVYTRATIEPNPVESDNAFLLLKSFVNPGDYSVMPDFYAAMDAEGQTERDANWTPTMNVEFDSMNGSYEYMQDFDIGDVCSIEIQEVGVSANARLIGCYEVIKQGVWTLTMEFGTPIIKR